MDIDALKTELLMGHPDTGAYDADDQIAMDQINTVNRTRNRTAMTGTEVLQSIDETELAAVAADKRDQIWGVIGLESINPFGVEKELFVDAFGNGSATVTSLAALRVESISRAVELGLGTVKLGHIEMARA